LVAVVRIRVYLDFDLDESYTPTKMIFLAGMGGNDLVEFATWEGDAPCGWVDVPLQGVGGRNGGWVREDMVRHKRRSKSARRQTRHRGEDAEGEEEPNSANEHDIQFEEGGTTEDPEDPYAGNVLKAMVIQMRVMENHQNGKDTHVRGFQVFACDDTRRRVAAAPSASADGRHRRHSARQSLRGGITDLLHSRTGSEDIDTGRLISTSGLDEPDWMGEPVIR
jgi:anaphase-promoting complex subunit 10